MCTIVFFFQIVLIHYLKGKLTTETEQIQFITIQHTKHIYIKNNNKK